jgi:hypothetical protein
MSDASAAREAACARVYCAYPLFRGVRPTVAVQGARRVYTFAKSVQTSPGGSTLRQWVRATVDEGGRVVKVVASR